MNASTSGPGLRIGDPGRRLELVVVAMRAAGGPSFPRLNPANQFHPRAWCAATLTAKKRAHVSQDDVGQVEEHLERSESEYVDCEAPGEPFRAAQIPQHLRNGFPYMRISVGVCAAPAQSGLGEPLKAETPLIRQVEHSVWVGAPTPRRRCAADA
jgi:hypothetical protein